MACITSDLTTDVATREPPANTSSGGVTGLHWSRHGVPTRVPTPGQRGAEVPRHGRLSWAGLALQCMRVREVGHTVHVQRRRVGCHGRRREC